MAQRAYRQRKETTLDDLRKRVSDLTTTMECMNKAFEDCRDRLVSAGLPEGQLDELAEVTVRYAGFMKTVRRPSDAQEEAALEPVAPAADPASNATRQAGELPLVAKNVPSWMDPATIGQTGRRTQKPEVGMGYTMVMPGAFDQLVDNFNVPSLAQAMQPPGQTHELPSMNPFDQSAPNILHQPSLSLNGELPAPKTYSFQETTLARRLHRACLEGAYLLLLDPSRRPHTYDRVFKLSLLSRDRVRMAASIKHILNRGLEEPLDFWDAPLLHIGGAGTHYPERQRRDSREHLLNKPKFHLGMIGPQMLNLLENVVQARPAAEISVEIEGFEGEWFDPYDIEGYLESRGIHIDPTVSFVEAEISDLEPASSTNSTYSSGRTSNTVPRSRSKGTTTAWDQEQWSELQNVEADMNRWQEMENVQITGLGNVGYSDANTGSWMNLNPNPQSQQQQKVNGNAMDMSFDLSGAGANGFEANFPGYGPAAAPEPQKKVVIIDVAKFVKGMCLPLFCRSSVWNCRKLTLYCQS